MSQGPVKCNRWTANRAFTLIELLVVILIVAVLIAVALPAFLGQTAKAQDSVVAQRLTVAYSDAKAIWTADGQAGYPQTDAMRSALQQAEPGYKFVDDDNAQNATKQSIGVSVNPADSQELTLCEQSQSGTMFCLRADEAGQLLDLSGSETTTGEAFAPASANADTGYTELVRSSAADETDAVCVLNTASPKAAGGAGSTDIAGCHSGVAGWPASASSATTTATTPQQVPSGGVPTISSTSPSVGVALTGSPGTWTGTDAASTYTYQWQRCTGPTGTGCTNIANATAASYTPQLADAGDYLVLVVSASNEAGQSAPASSAPTGAITAPAPTNTVAPAVTPDSGLLQGSALQASPGTWTNAAQLSAQWQRCDSSGANCANITGATATSYTVTSADVGSTLRVLITASNPSASTSQASAATAEVDAYGAAVSSGGAPVDWYRFNEPSGATQASDSGSSPITLTASGGVTFGQPGAPNTGTAAHVNGASGAWLHSSTSNITSTSNWTINVWFKPDSASEDGYIAGFGNAGYAGTNGNGASLVMTSTGTGTNQPEAAGDCLLGLEEAVVWIVPSTSSPACGLSPSSWYLATLTRDNATTTLYIDGTSVASTTQPPLAGNAQLYSGSSNGSYRGFSGDVDELTFYNRALSQPQIQTIYTAGQ